MSEKHTVCAYCGVGCGLIIEEGVTTVLRPDPEHPANLGRLCAKGANLMETLSPRGRLLQPLLHGTHVSWSRAIEHIAERFGSIIERHGPDAVAFYVSGQMLTEDYYVANKLMKGFIGSANIDTNSRLCMASTVAGHARAFGADTVPGCYQDLEEAEMVVLTGSNMASCHPVLFQRILDARARGQGPYLVVIDPRRSETAQQADLHLALRPGSDGFLFCGLLNHMWKLGRVDFAFLERHVHGYVEALDAVTDFDLRHTAELCGLDQASLADFMTRFALTERVVTAFSQGINQSSSGTDKVNAIINCHLATGRIGKPGAGPFSLTGQGNAMGGREVGGLANQLTAHMKLENSEHRRLVADFWEAPNIAERAGLKAIDLFEAVAEGRVKALWVACTNPLVSLPNADRVRQALAKCELLVVSECMAHTETAAFADVLLPAATWGEKSGTVTNSERVISRQRGFRRPLGEARPDWAAFAAVGRAMGFQEAFTYANPAAIFREYAALSGLGNDGSRDFDISALADLTDAQYDGLRPIQWPVNREYPQGRARFFDDGRFFHADGRARMLPIQPRFPSLTVDGKHDLLLLTGRVADQWHTMSRTGGLSALRRRDEEPFVAMHPVDAAERGIDQVVSGLVRVETRYGGFLSRVRITEDQPMGSMFAPFHWNDTFAWDAKVNSAVNPTVDPISGQPELKATPASIHPLEVGWHGFVISSGELTFEEPLYWVRIPGDGYIRHELAFAELPSRCDAWARELLGLEDDYGEWLFFGDEAAGSYRAANLMNGRLRACLFLAREYRLPPRRWLETLFLKENLEHRERRGLLAGALV